MNVEAAQVTATRVEADGEDRQVWTTPTLTVLGISATAGSGLVGTEDATSGYTS